MGENEDDKHGQAGQLFENFIQATTCKGTLQAFNILTRQLELDPQDHRHFYTKLKSKVTSWKAKALWNKLDKKHGQKEYKKGKACIGTKCLIIGGGPCGLRTAIELSCLGAKVVVVEKRDTFSRNNVLHLWPYTIHDLRYLGAKKFYGKFCAGAIDHISIWQLQLMLFKVALLHGIEIHVNVEFMKLLEPLEDQENQKTGWRAEFLPQDYPLSDYEFDVIIGADGRRNTLEGFRRKEFRGKLAIAITANFINRNTTAEAKVEEISGVAFIFNQKFFQDLKEETGIDLENIVYYKDSTHYFVMTAKKQSLLDKGVIINDYADAEMLLCTENVDQDNLQSYAREAADFATNYQLPSLDFAINHYGQPDVAMFDFTSMYASENAALVRERHGHQLLVALVGDSLLEPFWPMGTGCARGFLAAFDTAWMVRSWAQGAPPLELLAERESLYRLLPQTTPENISKNFDQYTIDPGTRYPNLNSNCVRTHQVKHLFITNELQTCSLERASSIRRSVGVTRHESDVRPNKLLVWCQKQTAGYRNVSVANLTSSWKSGLALCALIHRFRPELVDFNSLNEEDMVGNNQLAFDIAEREFGISPMTTGKEMVATEEPDKLSMVLYLSKFYELFRGAPLRTVDTMSRDNGDTRSSKPSNLIVNNYLNLTLPRKRVPKDEKTSEDSELNKRRRTIFRCFEEPPNIPSRNVNSGNECNDTKEVINQNKVKSMATQLLAKFEENAPNTSLRRQGSLRKEFPANIGGSDTCYFCKRRVYVVERLSAEGHFFHRECFKCAFCSTSIRLGNYVFNVEEGKFYCQPHFMHSFSKNKHRKRRTESKVQEEDKTWKSSEAEAAEVATDSAYSACSSSGESSPDEPTSPKKSRGNHQFKDFRRRVSSVEWKSVRIASQVEGAGHNLLAERVMVMTDESSSDIECEVFEDVPNHHSKEPLRIPSLCIAGHQLTQAKGTATRNDASQEYSDQSTPYTTTVHAQSNQSVASSKHHRWKKKVQSTFPLIIAKKSTHASRESYSPGSSPDEEVFGRNEPNGNMKSSNPLGREERNPEVISYVPHYKEQQDRTAHNGIGLPGTAEQQVPDHNWEVNTYREYNQHGSRESKGAEQTGHRYHGDPMNLEVTSTKNPTLKKLVLSKEEKSDLLEWSCSEPRAPVGSRTERTSSQTNCNPSGETENKKSTFAILSNAIKRSFTKSISSAPESPKKSPQKVRPESQGNYFDFPSSIFRRGCSNFEYGTNGTEMDCLSSTMHSNTINCQDEGRVWESRHSQKIHHDPSSVRLDDIPRMLANVSIKENQNDGTSRIASYRSRKNSLFSSLRLKSKASEDSLHASSNETWSVFGSFRRKLSDKEPRVASNLPSSARSGLALKEATENSSSSEDELTSNNSYSRKASRELRHRRKMEREAKKKAKQEELKRLHKAQTIQRQLQETEEKLRALEIQGVKLEKALRGESDSGAHSESQLLHEWFQIAVEKNKLNRYEAELLFTARELELEDQQGRLEQILREKMLTDPALKDEADNEEEQELFAEMMKIIEQRDQLVTSIEEQRVQERSVEWNLQGLQLSKDRELKMSLIHKKRLPTYKELFPEN
ncbi:F-actin-monooxygenase MICAL2-like isoform X3 [Xenopus laevis]|uniref:F-actin monooxygenase n=1 Tax=Xenopus laevis TaxID=8355 RepID=A0A8J1KHV0_XENLA|nr:F-actin-monooxygenase MICAL2-like isoform X3 [Xenopus laevis]